MARTTGATLPLMASSAATSIGTIALADQLNHLRARVPLSEQDVAHATGAEQATVRQWIERKAAPMGVEANRLAELIAVVEEMALNIEPDGIPEWLRDEIPALEGGIPADVIASGGYQRVIDIALWLSAGGFT